MHQYLLFFTSLSKLLTAEVPSVSVPPWDASLSPWLHMSSFQLCLWTWHISGFHFILGKVLTVQLKSKKKHNMRTDWGEGCYVYIDIRVKGPMDCSVLQGPRNKVCSWTNSLECLHKSHAFIPKWESSSLRNPAAKAGLLQITNYNPLWQPTETTDTQNSFSLKSFEILSQCNNLLKIYWKTFNPHICKSKKFVCNLTANKVSTYV